MHTIEVDFDVLKALMNKRPTEAVSYNDVLRKLLGLGEAPPVAPAKTETATGVKTDWVVKGVRFPGQTPFRVKHDGQTHVATVSAEGLELNGKTYDSPSAAGFAITGYAVNGWKFWECKLPGTDTWRPMSSFRKG